MRQNDANNNDISIYPYATGNRLEDRNTYFYTEFLGHEFLNAWKCCRERALAYFSSVCSDDTPPHVERFKLGAMPQPHSPNSVTGALLEEAAKLAERQTSEQVDKLLMQWVKKFETSKRVYDSYDSDFRPVDRNVYGELSHYVRLAEIFESSYRRTEALPFLNALLKILDTLIAMQGDLPFSLAGRMAELIKREYLHVSKLARRTGVHL